MEKRKIVLGLVVLVVALIAAGVILAQEGFRHVYPGSDLRIARESWESGQAQKALEHLVSGAIGALECGVRDRMAQANIDQMHALQANGQLEAELQACLSAVRTLGGCDDEGELGSACALLQMKIGGLAP